MRILFLIPSSNKVPERIYGCSYQLYSQPELPILYAAAQLPEHEVDFQDLTLEDKFEDNSDFDAYVFHSVLLSKDIDVQAAKKIREKSKALLVFFGPEPTRTPEDFLFDERCFVVRGEAEITLKNLLSNPSNKDNIKGISFLKDNRVVHNETFGIIEDLDKLAFPARHLAKKYESNFYNTKIPSKPHHLILTSRGCIFRCYFCVPNAISWARELEWRRYHQNQKPPLKIRSAENIIKEFKKLAEQGYKSVWVMDDMFLWGKERSLKILGGIKGLDLEIGILARADFIDKDIAQALKEANCKVVDMGVESFDQEILDYIKKDLKTERIERAINDLKEKEIIPEINLMFGTSPLETKEGIKETIRKAIKTDAKYVLFSIATPFPGTDLEKRAREEKWIIEEKFGDLIKNLDPSSKSLLSFPNLSNQDLEDLIKYAKRKFYFRPRYIWWKFWQIKSFSELSMLIKTAFKLLR